VANQSENKSQGKRVGAHPILVIFGVIFGIWLFITLIIPKSKGDKQQPGTPSHSIESLRLSTVSTEFVPIFKTNAIILDVNAII